MIDIALVIMVLVTLALTIVYVIAWIGSVADDSHSTRIKVAICRDVVLALVIMGLITCFKLYSIT